MNWIALQAGLENSNSAAARSWLNIGFDTQNPKPGDVVIFWRDDINGSHVKVGD